MMKITLLQNKSAKTRRGVPFREIPILNLKYSGLFRRNFPSSNDKIGKQIESKIKTSRQAEEQFSPGAESKDERLHR